MEKERKELKAFSILILAFVAIELIRAVVELCVNGIPQIPNIPADIQQIFETFMIVVFVIVLLFYIPEVYMGIKGIKVANNPTVRGRGHIVWAVIFIIFSIIGTISSVYELTQVFNLDNAINVIDPVVNLLVYIFYYRFASKIADAR